MNIKFKQWLENQDYKRIKTEYYKYKELFMIETVWESWIGGTSLLEPWNWEEILNKRI